VIHRIELYSRSSPSRGRKLRFGPSEGGQQSPLRGPREGQAPSIVFQQFNRTFSPPYGPQARGPRATPRRSPVPRAIVGRKREKGRLRQEGGGSRWRPRRSPQPALETGSGGSPERTGA